MNENGFVIRIKSDRLGTFEWKMPKNIQKLYIEMAAHDVEPKEFEKRFELLNKDWSQKIEAFLNLLCAGIIYPPNCKKVFECIEAGLYAIADRCERLFPDRKKWKIIK